MIIPDDLILFNFFTLIIFNMTIEVIKSMLLIILNTVGDGVGPSIL